MSGGFVTLQIGKAGITPAVIAQLNRLLEHHKHIRISLLPASGRNHQNLRAMAGDMVKQLAMPCKYTIIGFTIVLRKRSPAFKTSK